MSTDAIVNYFVQSSPPNEVDFVIGDVLPLSGGNDSALPGMLQKYNQEHFVRCKVTGGDKEGEYVIVCPQGMVDAERFVHPESGEIMAIDHSKREARGTGENITLPDKVAEFRAAIEVEGKKYIEGQYRNTKTAATSIAVYGKDDGTIHIVISSTNTKLSSFWSGSWRSAVNLNVNSNGNTQMQGKVKLQVHYFEDGNVQLHGTKEKNVQVNVSSPEETAKTVVKAITEWESTYQSNMEEMYVELHTKTFKEMRRFLPKNGQEFDWNPNRHKMVGELGGGK
jgi:capping protein alpha